jgi:hypothetical protein
MGAGLETRWQRSGGRCSVGWWEGSGEVQLTLTTDNGTQFNSSRFLETLSWLGITHRRTEIYFGGRGSQPSYDDSFWLRRTLAVRNRINIPTLFAFDTTAPPTPALTHSPITPDTVGIGITTTTKSSFSGMPATSLWQRTPTTSSCLGLNCLLTAPATLYTRLGHKRRPLEARSTLRSIDSAYRIPLGDCLEVGQRRAKGEREVLSARSTRFARILGGLVPVAPVGPRLDEQVVGVPA